MSTDERELDSLCQKYAGLKAVISDSELIDDLPKLNKEATRTRLKALLLAIRIQIHAHREEINTLVDSASAIYEQIQKVEDVVKTMSSLDEKVSISIKEESTSLPLKWQEEQNKIKELKSKIEKLLAKSEVVREDLKAL